MTTSPPGTSPAGPSPVAGQGEPGPATPTGVRRRLGDPWLVASLAGLALLVALALWFGPDAGAIWDDEFHHIYGQAVLRWFETGGKDVTALTYRNLYLYGGLFDALAELVVRVSPLGVYETRHVMTALAGVGGVCATWWMAALVGGRRAGFLAAALLALTPVWTGHALVNPKDVPFAAALAFALAAGVRAALAPAPLPWGTALLAGAATGAALGIRPGGLYVLGFLGVGGLRAVVDVWRGGAGRRVVGVAAGRILVAVGVAWAFMILAWPRGQVSPLTAPFEALREAANFKWRGQVLFDGVQRWSTALPWTYLPKWFAVTLPGTWALALAAGGIAAARAIRARSLDSGRIVAGVLLAAAAVGPVLLAIVVRPVLYDAQRHFLFVLPPAAALAGLGLSAFLGSASIPRAWRGAVAVAGVLLGAAVAVEMARLHPYEYVFFNRLVGGLPGAAGRYETDYWGASYREGVEWVAQHVRRDDGIPVTVASCSAAFQVGAYLPPFDAERRFVLVDQRDAQVLLATTRFDCHRTPGQVLHVVEREGVPLLYVILRGAVPP